MILLLACTELHPVDLGEVQDRDLDGYDENTDCDDRDQEIHPGADEIWYDGVDQDCDWNDDDQDYDGYPASTDCDDQDPARNPGEPEVWYDGVDQDCDGNDGDRDGDGHEHTPGMAGGDCNDGDAEVHPGAEEVWYDGIDQDCDHNDGDQDGDGYDAEQVGGIDCDDEDRAMPGWFHTDADQDGFGVGEVAWLCGDSTGWSTRDGDCDDDAADVNPTQTEICDDGLDNDCSGDANSCGAPEIWGSTIEGTASATLSPTETGSYFGYALATSDLDGDGVGDLVVGGYKGGDDNEGEVTVAYGPVVSATSWDHTVYGGASSARAGRTIAAAGDADFDGYEEVWVGIPYADVLGNDDGGVVLLGLDTEGDLLDAEVALWGAGNTDRLGWGLASVDLDGDGFVDLAAGASLDGRVEVVLGPHEGPLEADATWFGDAGFGTTLTAMPDTDGDGRSELLVGAPDAGVVTLHDTDGQVLASIELGASAGSSLATGDLDGDGFADLAIGSPDEAVVWLVHGPLEGALQTDDALELAGALDGSALVACDVDGDGQVDLASGTPGPLGGSLEGWIGLYEAGTLTERPSSTPGAATGAALACGDLDGDGLDDLVVGSPYADTVHVLPGGGL